VSRARAVETLLAGLVDYAGLFPPAALAMPDVVRRYATYARGADRALLGRLVLPVARLDEFTSAVVGLDDELAPTARAPWRLSVLASAGDATTLAAFNATAADRCVIDTIEARAESVDAINGLAQALGATYAVYIEIPVRDDPATLIAAIGSRGLRAKIRTGGVTSEAFPAPGEVLRFLTACANAHVPFKATAGLHHPLRGEYALTYAADAPRGMMYGFLNIFLSAALLRVGVEPSSVAPLLEETDARAISWDDESVRWRSWAVARSDLAASREEFAGSFGSCSFEEPVQDLTSLRLL
jgi:hypothetical protein